MPSIVFASTVYGLSTAGAALVSGPSRGRSVLAGLLALGALASPLLLDPSPTLLRFALSAAGLVVAFRVVDLARDRRRWSIRTRAWLFTAIYDVREVERIEPRLEAGTLGWGLTHLALAVGGLWLALGIGGLEARYIGGVIAIYGLHGVAGDAMSLAHAAVGLALPLQYRPLILARGVGRFWSAHYNLNVSRWLARHLYVPLVRRGHGRWAGVATFGFSAVFHAWIAWVVLLDVEMAGLWFAFFAIQGLVAAAERPVGVARWRRPAQHAWTVAWLVGTSPLFVEPFLRVLEG